LSSISDNELIVKVLDFYPSIGKLQTVERGGGTAGRNLIFTADNKKYFLRGRNPNYSTEQETIYDHSLMKYLAEKGFPVPKPILSSENKTWVKLNGRIYELYEYIPGRRFNPQSLLDLQSLGIALARYHEAVNGFKPQGLKPRVEKREDHPELIKPILEDMLKDAKSSVLKTIKYLLDQLLLIQENMSDERYLQLPQLIIHGDFHPANIIFGYDNKIYFTDFDWAGMQAKARDIVDGIMFFAAKREKPIHINDIVSLTQPFEIDFQRSKIFLNAYREIKKVYKEEIEALPWLIRSRWIQERAKGSRKVPQEKRLQYLVERCEEPLYWLDKWQDTLVKTLKQP
jgi:Ser/Thr protein kinase RdoA (MazF antagonist)